MGVCVAKQATARDGQSPQGDGRKTPGRGGRSRVPDVEREAFYRDFGG